jgi:multiple sugar transport system permease protein
MQAPRRFHRAVTYLLLGAWSLICLFPAYWLAVTSVKSVPDVERGPRYLPFVDFQPDLSAWRFIFEHPTENLVPQLLNSAVISLASSLIAIMAAAACLYGLTRFPVSGRASTAMMTALLAPRLLPPAVVALPLYVMAQSAGLLDTRSTLIFTYAAVNLPVAVWLLRPVLGLRASEQEEAARLDGASHRLILFSVVLPMAAGGLGAAGLLVFILSWNEYLFAAYLATNHAATVPVWLVGQLAMKEAQASAEGTELANFSAAATLLLIPVLLFTGLVHRLLAKSLVWRP